MQFTVESMFGEVGKRFDQLAADQQVDLLNAIRDFIAHLPHEQQAQIRDKLGINDLSDEYLRKALLSGTLASAFAGVVSIGGFGFYMGAVSLLATMAGLVGLTLPFAVYTPLTSAVFVGSNPLFFLPVVGNGGVMLYRTQNDALRKRLAVNAVVQLALAGSSLGALTEAVDNRRRAIEAWKEATDSVQRTTDLRTSAEEEAISAEQALSVARSLIRQTRGQAAGAEAEKERLLTVLRGEFEAAAQDMAVGEWGEQARHWCSPQYGPFTSIPWSSRPPSFRTSAQYMTFFLFRSGLPDLAIFKTLRGAGR